MFDKNKADIAFKQDRERFFREADKFEMVSYLSDRLTEKEKSELGKKILNQLQENLNLQKQKKRGVI